MAIHKIKNYENVVVEDMSHSKNNRQFRMFD